MIDPITALSVAASAVGNAKQLLAAGRDATGALSKFAGAIADVNYVAEKAKNPSIWKSLTGSAEAEAIEIFAAQKKAIALKKDLETILRLYHGQKGLDDYRALLRKVRAQRKQNEHRRAEIKEALIAWAVGILATLAGLAGLGLVFWWIGKTQGKF